MEYDNLKSSFINVQTRLVFYVRLIIWWLKEEYVLNAKQTMKLWMNDAKSYAEMDSKTQEKLVMIQTQLTWMDALQVAK